MKPTKLLALLLVLSSQNAASMGSTMTGAHKVKPCSRAVERARSAKPYDTVARQVASLLGIDKATTPTAGRSTRFAK